MKDLIESFLFLLSTAHSVEPSTKGSKDHLTGRLIEYSMAPFDCTIRWHYSMALFDGTIRWHHSMALFDGTIRWHHSIAPFDGTIRWHHSITPFDRTIRWHIRWNIPREHSSGQSIERSKTCTRKLSHISIISDACIDNII